MRTLILMLIFVFSLYGVTAVRADDDYGDDTYSETEEPSVGVFSEKEEFSFEEDGLEEDQSKKKKILAEEEELPESDEI